MARDPGEVPVYRHGFFFYRQVQKQSGPTVLGSSKAITFRPCWYFGVETGSQGPHFARFLRLSEGSPGIFFVPEISFPRTFGVVSDRRTRRVPRPLFRGDEEVGKLRDPAKDREKKDNGRRGKKTTEARGKKKDDGGRKKKINEQGNRYI